MKKIIKLSIVLLLIVITTGCKNKNKISNLNEYKSLIENKETFILEIMKTNCTYCEKIKPKLEEIKKEYNIDIKVINISNLSEEDNNELLQITGYSGTPTIIFYNDGIELTKSSRINGNASKEYIVSKMKTNGFITEKEN